MHINLSIEELSQVFIQVLITTHSLEMLTYLLHETIVVKQLILDTTMHAYKNNFLSS